MKLCNFLSRAMRINKGAQQLNRAILHVTHLKKMSYMRASARDSFEVPRIVIQSLEHVQHCRHHHVVDGEVLKEVVGLDPSETTLRSAKQHQAESNAPM